MAARSEAEVFQVFDLGYPGLQPGVIHFLPLTFFINPVTSIAWLEQSS
jgi:hypothetical protein